MKKNEPLNISVELMEAYKKMTPREVEVFELILGGETNKEVGKELNISWRTVKKNRENICDKLKLKGPNALFKWAVVHM